MHARACDQTACKVKNCKQNEKEASKYLLHYLSLSRKLDDCCVYYMH